MRACVASEGEEKAEEKAQLVSGSPGCRQRVTLRVLECDERCSSERVTDAEICQNQTEYARTELENPSENSSLLSLLAFHLLLILSARGGHPKVIRAEATRTGPYMDSARGCQGVDAVTLT